MTIETAPPALQSPAELILYRLNEVATILRVDPSSVRRWVRNGKLRVLRPIGARGTVRVTRTELERFLQAGAL